MTHRFRPGQRVRLISHYPHRFGSTSLYEVVRQLPYSDGEYQYRVKGAHEAHERVVKESEMLANTPSLVE